jgi:hypothetical protein
MKNLLINMEKRIKLNYVNPLHYTASSLRVGLNRVRYLANVQFAQHAQKLCLAVKCQIRTNGMSPSKIRCDVTAYNKETNYSTRMKFTDRPRNCRHPGIKPRDF